MRALSQGFTQKLDSEVTTLAFAWLLTRSDGTILRITNHDRDLVIGGELYRAVPTIDAGQLEMASGLGPDSFHAIGFYEIDGINEKDILLGHWDNASVKLLIVDWSEPENFAQIWHGNIKGFRQSKFGFELELIGPEHALSLNIGRQFTRHCDALLGDERCKVNLALPAYHFAANINAIDGDRIIKINSALPPLAFENGSLAFLSGDLIGLSFDIYSIEKSNNVWKIELERAMPILAKTGDQISIKVGCDKSFASCRDKFSNQANFRGCPHMPGEDFAFSAAK